MHCKSWRTRAEVYKRQKKEEPSGGILEVVTSISVKHADHVDVFGSFYIVIHYTKRLHIPKHCVYHLQQFTISIEMYICSLLAEG